MNNNNHKIAFFQTSLLSWFKTAGRHHFPWRKNGLTDFQIVIAEVLLQRTKAETVNNFYPQFIITFPHWHWIASAEISTLEDHLKPIGLYRQRAKRIKALALQMVRLNGQLPSQRIDLEHIPLLGQYIVNAIQLQVFGVPAPLLDVNMARVLERFFGERKMADIRYDPYLQKLADQVVAHSFAKEINWAILDFAALVCKARKPLCEKCILASHCTFYRKVLN
ncbi:MAG: hypothetical protein QM731_08775 [Chitinophagaceae bacterium]